MITVETATVYRGGRRRWFSLKAACNAEAAALHRQHYKNLCECSKGDWETPGETCHYHESDFYHRWISRVSRVLAHGIVIPKEPTL